jgi:hypothetical protein
MSAHRTRPLGALSWATPGRTIGVPVRTTPGVVDAEVAAGPPPVGAGAGGAVGRAVGACATATVAVGSGVAVGRGIGVGF